MNPIYREASELATGGTLMGIVTVAFTAFFVIVFLRMFRPNAAAAYAEAAQLPLDGNEGSTPDANGEH